MKRIAILALIGGLVGVGCVVTTGGEPSSMPAHRHQPRRHTSGGNAATPAPQPAQPTGGGAAVAAPPVATPVPGNTGTTTSTPPAVGVAPRTVPPMGRVPQPPPPVAAPPSSGQPILPPGPAPTMTRTH